MRLVPEMRRLLDPARRIILYAPPIWETPLLKCSRVTKGMAVTPFTFNMPEQRPNGDLYLVSVHRDDNTILGLPAGWTSLYSQNGADTMWNRVGYRVGSSEPATYQVTASANPGAPYYDDWVVGVLHLTGADTADPINGHNVSTGTSNSATAPAVTVDEGGTMVVRFFTADNLSPSVTMGTADTEYRHDATHQHDIHVACIVEEGPGSGQSTGTKSISFSGSTQWIAATVAINRA